MRILIMIRPILADLAILATLLYYEIFYSGVRGYKNQFRHIIIWAIVFVSLGLTTEITVNLESCPVLLNTICHKVYFASAIVFSSIYIDYIIASIASKRSREKARRVIIVFGVIVTVAMLVLPVWYERGQFTSYSQGSSVMICFGYAVLLFLLSDAVVIVHLKRIRPSLAIFVLISSALCYVCLALQIVFPEFLFVECAITVMTAGIFFQIENPVKHLQERSFIDFDTGTYNKNCYEFDVQQLNKNASENELSCLVCDLNNLKYINDNYGHIEGDKLIAAAADVIMKVSGGRVYRLGGDEFIVLMENDSEMDSQQLLEDIQAECQKRGENFECGLSMAVGYARREGSESIDSLIQRADKTMYRQKEKMKETMDLKFKAR